MFFRVLVMIAVLLGLWLGFGAPVVGFRVSPVKPDPSLPSFRGLQEKLREGPAEEPPAEEPPAEEPPIECEDGNPSIDCFRQME